MLNFKLELQNNVYISHTQYTTPVSDNLLKRLSFKSIITQTTQHYFHRFDDCQGRSSNIEQQV